MSSFGEVQLMLGNTDEAVTDVRVETSHVQAGLISYVPWE